MHAAMRLLIYMMAASHPQPTVVQQIDVREIGRSTQLVGKLHEPLGKVIELEGVVVEGPFKGYEGGPNLRVQRIAGRITQEDTQIAIKPFFFTWGESVGWGSAAGTIPLPKLEIGATYRLVGYETGGFVGTPGEAFERGAPIVQTTSFYFREYFEVIKGEEIEPIGFEPRQFTDAPGLVQGTAVTKSARGYMVGTEWSVLVNKDSAWPARTEGKLIETNGRYEQTSAPNEFELKVGNWRMVRLEDQIGQTVELRGFAWSMNGDWWFEYRGADLRVEGMENLPGWAGDNHGRRVTIRGTLGRERMPAPNPHERQGEVREHFIIRDASWTPNAERLSIDRPFPNRGPLNSSSAEK